MTERDDPSLLEITIDGVHDAMRGGRLTARALVEFYLARIDAYDKNGPSINSVISLNPDALKEADALDAAFQKSGPVGSLHGIPVLIKDQADAMGMATTMGSLLFEGHHPQRDAFAIAKLKAAGAIILGKTTLGELGAGDTHGSLFGSTRNVYDLERTAGGSSGGSGAAVSANLCTVAIGQEGFSSIRRPAAWNGVAGMRPTAGLVSRTGVYGGWPAINGSLGPMARNVRDLAIVLNTLVGYDAADPLTALGAHRIAESYSSGLVADALKGARLGIIREPVGHATDSASNDFKLIDDVFSNAVQELSAQGAEIVDPIVIPDLAKLLGTRARSMTEDDESFAHYVSGSAASPFKSRPEAIASETFKRITRGAQARWSDKQDQARYHEYLKAREQLMINLHQVMATHRLDAIVHKAVEHQPTLIVDGLNPPFRDMTGAIHINTFLVFVPSVVVPCGFTRNGLPAGLTFLGRPYDDANVLKLASAYEQATRHRRPPSLAS
jgi:Asp-tRNA(Asn)/Glu-tRNA(Gln) amidotransferase A subunit family amidase